MRRAFVVVAAVVLAGCRDVVSPPNPELSSALGGARIYLKANGIPDQYIVVLRNDVGDVQTVSQEMVSAVGGTLRFTYRHALKGFAAELPAIALTTLTRDPRVQYVEQDQMAGLASTQTGAPWGLDRVDQSNLPLDQNYQYFADGSGVTMYIIDTGIRTDHSEFGGRAVGGFDAVTPGGNASDCQGHGTHVAGIAGGATFGIAKAVHLVAVRVLDCQGFEHGSAILAGVDWVTGQKNANPSIPSVANMSVRTFENTEALNQGVTNSIASGIVYAIAAGNDSSDACNVSPAQTPNAITVGATNSADARWRYSNFGTCIDIFAPGENILSAGIASTTASEIRSGTSMATPHVAGAAALYLQLNPTASVSQVTSAIIQNASWGKLTSINSGSPNLLLYTAFIGQTISFNPVQYTPGVHLTWTPVAGAIGYKVYLSFDYQYQDYETGNWYWANSFGPIADVSNAVYDDPYRVVSGYDVCNWTYAVAPIYSTGPGPIMAWTSEVMPVCNQPY